VRAALGYRLVDFVGVSYGARDAAAYGTRFGRRLRSLTLDSPQTPTPVDPFRGAADFTHGQVDRVATICARSALCGNSGKRAVRDIASLVRRSGRPKPHCPIASASSSQPSAARTTNRSHRSTGRRSCSARSASSPTPASHGPQAGSRAPVEPGARYPDAPTLVLSGDIDASIPPATVRHTLRAYPRAQHASIAGSPHATPLSSACADELATESIDTLRVASTRCARPSLFDYPGVTAFPRRADESPAAKRLPFNRANRYRLQIARVAADAALDVLKRAFFPGATGPGLRGGTWRGDFGDTWTLTLDRVRWADDVAVSGTLHWSFDGGPLDAELTIDGPGRLDGNLYHEGGWFIQGAQRSIKITGTLAGTRVAARMPST
jgi:pimeloyl-ACP methyl ester carboxylesterase